MLMMMKNEGLGGVNNFEGSLIQVSKTVVY